MQKRTLITCALLYANGSLHLGHLVGYIQTDIYTRFLKLLGEDAAYVCADDTHGAPIQINAEKQGITPEKLVSDMYKQHVRDFKDFKVEFDEYYTTHSEENNHYSDKLFKIAKDKGYIYKKDVEQLYCESCKRFLPDRYVKGKCPKCGADEQYGDVCEKCGTSYNPTELINPFCSTCGKTPITKTSNHYFFKLTAFSEKLREWLENNKNLQKEVVNSVRYWIDSGLEDWDITRDAPYFGFNIPGEDDLYYYVWWDAPIGYISSSQHYLQKNGKKDAIEHYWANNDCRIIHFIGKDIIYFHFLFWPAVLMAAELNLPEDIVVNGFLTINGEKMSKSRGTFINAREYLDNGNDPEHLRYYFARMLSKKLSDVDFNEEEFKAKINNELLANIGNFCYRVISFSNKHFDGKIAKEGKKLEKINESIENIKSAYMEFNFKAAMNEILNLSAIGNRYFQENEPWKNVKENRESVEKVLNTCLNIVRAITVALKPVMPHFSSRIEAQLNEENLDFNSLEWKTDFTLENPEMLLEKLEDDVIKKHEEMPFNLKVAKILDVKPHPDADKLLLVQVDLGDEKRQIVAGLKPFYKPEELTGKKIVIVSNLEKAKLRGEKSEGMLLAADDGENVKVVEPEKSEPGERVYIEAHENSESKISFKEFIKYSIQVKDSQILLKEKPLKTDKELLSIEMDNGSKVR
ncbi:MAG: methionine--tRNA ligase [Nanobdellota archaeon]